MSLNGGMMKSTKRVHAEVVTAVQLDETRT